MSCEDNVTHYDLLDVRPSEDLEKIKTNYRVLAMRSHPDTSKDANAREHFRMLCYAYSTLSDSISRKEYDSHLRVHGAIDFEYKAPISDTDADSLFLDAMFDLATELAGVGYGPTFIEKALTEEGCPLTVAKAAAKYSSRQMAEATAKAATNDTLSRLPAPDGRNSNVSNIAPMPLGVEPASGSLTRGFPANSSRNRVPHGIGLSLILLGAYFFGYVPYMEAKKEAEVRRVAEIAARAAEAEKRLELEKLRVAAAERARERNERARERDMEERRNLTSAQINAQLESRKRADARADLLTATQAQRNAVATQRQMIAAEAQREAAARRMRRADCNPSTQRCL